jgi:DNA-binding PadR family transcriptional regulator
MHYDETHRRHRGPGRWEPANDTESRRWHDHHDHHDDDDEERGPRRGRGRGRGHFGPETRGGFFPGFPGGPGLAGGPGFAGGPGGPGGPGMHGFGPWMREGRGGGRGTRARRGDVRAAALALLAGQPMNGYQIIQEIGERSGGVWRPSPGSIYPALQQLEDEGLIAAEAADGGRRAYQLTDDGRAYAAAHEAELRAPWDDLAAGPGHHAAHEMRALLGQVAMAAFQVISAGTEAQAAQARQLLTDTRKALYRILAADDDAATGADTGGDTEK